MNFTGKEPRQRATNQLDVICCARCKKDFEYEIRATGHGTRQFCNRCVIEKKKSYCETRYHHVTFRKWMKDEIKLRELYTRRNPYLEFWMK